MLKKIIEMECMFCKRKGEKTFNIHFLCGGAQNTVKDDLTEFLGKEVERHLKPEDVVCNICMNMLDDIAKIKRNLWKALLEPNHSIHPIKLGKSWDFFARSAKNQFEESDFDEPITPSLTPLSVTPNPNRSTPSQFWSISHSKEYNQELEDRCARREMVKRQRSQSKASVISSGSYGNDEEVAKLFRGRKRKGRRTKSAGGLPKVMTKKLRRVQSENGRSISSLSDLSCLSCTRPKKDFRPKTPKLIFGEDNELIRPKTRSISRMVSYCTVCLEDQKNLENYAAHMIIAHKRKACYRCLDCGVNYMTEEHLTMHQKIHKSPTICTICGEKHGDILALQKHTDRHFQYSVPCSYCDLSFLSEYECNFHIFSHHRGRRRKLRDRKQYKVEQIVTYVNVENSTSANSEPWDSNYSTKKYNVIPMTLNIEKRPKFHNPSFDELDFRVRHPEPITIPKERSSLGDNLVQDSRFLNSQNSDSPTSILSDSDAEAPLSDSSVPEPLGQRKKIKSKRRRKSSASRDEDLSPTDSLLLNKLDSSVVDDRLSPQKRLSEFRNDSQTFVEDSDNSEQSDSVQTEEHYLIDGEMLQRTIDLADIVNINGSSRLSESNPQEDVELDPDIESE